MSVLKCMVEWSKDMYVHLHLQGNLGKCVKTRGLLASRRQTAPSVIESISQTPEAVGDLGLVEHD